MSGRRRLGVVLAMCLVGAVGCGHGRSSEAAEPTAAAQDATQLCFRLEEPRKFLAEEGLDFESLLTATGVQANGILGAIAFLTPYDVRGGERFRPALRFLALRAAAESDGSRKPPTLTEEVRRNAEELDRFLKQGGCA